jgi:hypothetical protein
MLNKATKLVFKSKAYSDTGLIEKSKVTLKAVPHEGCSKICYFATVDGVCVANDYEQECRGTFREDGINIHWEKVIG